MMSWIIYVIAGLIVGMALLAFIIIYIEYWFSRRCVALIDKARQAAREEMLMLLRRQATEEIPVIHDVRSSFDN